MMGVFIETWENTFIPLSSSFTQYLFLIADFLTAQLDLHLQLD